jgi:CBS domain-containing protein
MHVSTILKSKGRDVATLTPDDSVATACGVLMARRIGAIVVVDRERRIAGIVSERDIVRMLAQYGERTGALLLSDVMTREVVTCAPEDTIRHVMTVMTHRRVRHLPVVEDGRLAGIVSIGDVVKSRLEETELEAQVLRDYVMTSH